jgi:TonB-dependent starch-binding outer membrane protein SusC
MKRFMISFLCLLLPLVIYAQIKVTGSVKDASGEALVGASVIQKGIGNGVITDQNGIFSISVKGEHSVLQFSFLGYTSQSISVGTQRTLQVVLNESTSEFDEVVVIGYGTRKKSDVSGSIVSISEASIKSRPVQNVIQALQGKAAGVDIISNIRPGEVNSVNIRGNRSVTASNSPLFVVDGIILLGGLSSMNDINPNDIASIEILKDASASAIYGSRGANGVVLVTTKQGRKGEVQISYEGSVTFDKINSLTDWATAGESLDRTRQAYINAGEYKLAGTALTAPNKNADIEMFGNNDVATIAALNLAYVNDTTYNGAAIPTTDWVGMMTQTGITQNHTVNFSAGTNNSKLFMSIGYFDQMGTQLNQGYTRYTARMNGEVQANRWLKVGLSSNLARGIQDYGTINRTGAATGAKDLYGMALGQYLMAQPYDAAGDYVKYPGGNSTTPVYNPLIDINESMDRRTFTNIQTNVFGEIKFTPWLKFRSSYSLSLNDYSRGSWQSSKSTLRRYTVGAGAAASYETSKTYQNLIDNILSFNKKFADIHDVEITLLQEAQVNRTETSTISASKIISDASKWYNLSANTNGLADSYGTGFTKSQVLSYMGRLNYTLMDKYILSASMRVDGASVLAEGHKWATFPSIAGVWKMQQESFMEELPWISEMKVRFGYGVTGNAAVSPYTSPGPLAMYEYVFGTTPAIGYLPFAMANEELGWEISAQSNMGLDFGFLNNRITGSVDIYNTNTTGLLNNRTLPAILGYPFILQNIGKMNNKGVELTLSTRNIATKDFSWTTDLSWARNEEKIVETMYGKVDMLGDGLFIGYPRQVFRTYQVDGLWQDTPEDLAEIAIWATNGYKFAPGQYKPIEVGTPDHKLTDADKVIVGSDRPKWTGGMTNTITYKNFEMSCFIYARIGQKYFSSLQPGGYTGKYIGYVRKADLSEFWSATNTDAEWPRLHSNAALVSTTDVNQAMYINDGSFVSVRNISLAYSIPSNLLKKMDVSRLQLYTQVMNPFIFGGKCVQNGINPDDTNAWTSVNSVGDPAGGTNNNTMMVTSFVVGARIGF